MKRLIVCCDGTWQSLEKDYPTNVVKTVKSITPIDSQGIHQVVYYDEGIGSQSNISKEEDLTKIGLGHLQSKVEAIAGGAFGMGIDKNIKDAYRFLSTNYNPGDEIYLFGFSRGSYTVRSLAGMLSQCGLLKREHLNEIHHAYELYRDKTQSESTTMEQLRPFCQPNEEYDDRVPITLLACYDTVGSLGIPNIFDNIHIDKLINSRYAFHDTKLSKIIKKALHAVAVDEDRDTFSVTLMKKNPEVKDQILRQVWFPGGHGCVGGGTKRESLLSNNALLWMIASIKDIGLNLEFDINLLSDDEKLEGEYEGEQLTDATFDYNKQAEKQVEKEITDQIKGGADQFKLLTGLISTIKQAAMNAAGQTLREIPADDGIHRSVSERLHYSNLDYHPKNVSSERILSREQLESDDSILLTSQ
ncbi:MAG: DUF2235 domain-containing protein [Okeania sp. SIO3I5]|nr:DUF2235 domain-containing protein [Okeania sp. SIO3I5]